MRRVRVRSHPNLTSFKLTGPTELYDGLRKYADGIKGDFWAGNELTLADCTIAPFLARLYIIEEHRQFKALDVSDAFVGTPSQTALGDHRADSETAYRKRILELPEVKATTSDLEHYEEIYGRYLRDEAQSEAAKATRSGQVIP